MGLAPSEKHLEDWIVGNLDGFRWQGYLDYQTVLTQLIARQVKLPAGICDLIGLGLWDTTNVLFAVELKQGVIDSKTVAQCLRYIRDLQEVFVRVRYPYDPSGDYMIWDYETHGSAERGFGRGPEIAGIVVGHRVSDDNLLVACEAASIRAYTYRFENDTYTFQYQRPPRVHYRVTTYDDLAYGAIGEAMRAVIRDRWKTEREYQRHRKAQGFTK